MAADAKDCTEKALQIVNPQIIGTLKYDLFSDDGSRFTGN